MRKVLMLLMVFFLVGTENAPSENARDELIDIATFSEGSGLMIDHWEVTIREKKHVTELKNHIKTLEEMFTLTKKEEDTVTTYGTSEVEVAETISVSYSVVMPDNSHKQGELMATITGKSWDEQTKADYVKVNNLMTNDYFSHKAHKFTCLQAQLNDILSKMSLFEEIENTFNIKYQSSQTDNIQPKKKVKEVYGYTDLWKSKIMIMDEPMNIHIAFLEKANEKETVIIGTPILINEY